MTGMDDATEKATRTIYGAMHRDTDPYSVPLERAAEKAARALADVGLLCPDVRWLAENIRNTNKTHGWHTKRDLLAVTLQLVGLILGPDPDPPVPIMIPTPDTDDWDF